MQQTRSMDSAPIDIERSGDAIAELMHRVLFEVKRVVVGQDHFLERVLVAMLAQGHLLVEGVPGLAKTLTVKTLARTIHGSFKRIQFTPDLVPADLVGTRIWNQRTGEFATSLCPVFANLLLADEINRAPAKVQSALLEAMQERQITVGGQTRALPELFMVMATQNPIEQAGTYPLPEAQLDRFMLHVSLDYPAEDEEREILRRDQAALRSERPAAPLPVLDVAGVLAARRDVHQVHLADAVEAYVVSLVRATRRPGDWRADWVNAVEVGASPRASLALAHASAAWAYLQGRDYVTPDDVREIAPDVLRHRLTLSLEAHLQQLDRDALIAGLIDAVPAP